eukprot:Platyproteum_vivax@DN433_c0_g1_i1.p1
MAQYGNPEYWNERYTKDPEHFDWYQRYAGIKSQVNEYVPNKVEKVLMIGAGNSRLSEEMVEDGYEKIINVDISKVVTDAMKEKYSEKAELEYEEMDCREMKFENGEFEAAIDKGTLDSLLCGDNSNVSASKMLEEISRVLSPTGVYMCISYGQPSYRLQYFQKKEYTWNVKHVTVPKPQLAAAFAPTEEKENVHYIYICTKMGEDTSAAQAPEGQAAPCELISETEGQFPDPKPEAPQEEAMEQ